MRKHSFICFRNIVTQRNFRGRDDIIDYSKYRENKMKTAEIYNDPDWWKKAERKTVADYLERAVEDYEQLYVIEVKGNSFLAVLLDDLDDVVNRKFKKLKATSLLSATCFQSELLADFMLRLLAKGGVNTKSLKISSLSKYLNS